METATNEHTEPRVGTRFDVTRQTMRLTLVAVFLTLFFAPEATSAAAPRTYHANQQYSVAALTDETGSVVERYKYDPYGKVTVLAADGTTVRTASSYGNMFYWQGGRLDAETGLYYKRQRMYDSNLGRFISRWTDSADDTSMYQFQFSQPTIFNDPFGDPYPSRKPPQGAPNPSNSSLGDYWNAYKGMAADYFKSIPKRALDLSPIGGAINGYQAINSIAKGQTTAGEIATQSTPFVRELYFGMQQSEIRDWQTGEQNARADLKLAGMGAEDLAIIAGGAKAAEATAMLPAEKAVLNTERAAQETAAIPAEQEVADSVKNSMENISKAVESAAKKAKLQKAPCPPKKKVPDYGWSDPKYWNLVERLKQGQRVTVKSKELAESILKDAFPDATPNTYRGPLSEQPDVTMKYDFHDPAVMPHHPELPHFQVKTMEGDIVKIHVDPKG